jgi:hypothetical protein
MKSMVQSVGTVITKNSLFHLHSLIPNHFSFSLSLLKLSYTLFMFVGESSAQHRIIQPKPNPNQPINQTSIMIIPNNTFHHTSNDSPVWLLSPFQSTSEKYHDGQQHHVDDIDDAAADAAAAGAVYFPPIDWTAILYDAEEGYDVEQQENNGGSGCCSIIPEGLFPKPVLGFDPSIGRGFVYSTDQTSLGKPEYLFLDTPGDPDLQILCSRIITKYSHNNDNIIHNSDGDDGPDGNDSDDSDDSDATLNTLSSSLRRVTTNDKDEDDDSIVSTSISSMITDEEVAPNLTLTFATRYINPQCLKDLTMKKLLEDVYFEGKDLTFGIIVKIPAMHHHHEYDSYQRQHQHTATLATFWGSGGYPFPEKVTNASLDNWIEVVCMDYYASNMMF